MNKKKMLSAITAMLVAAGLGGYTIVEKTKLKDQANEIRITKIVDGDTIKIKSDAMGLKSVRFLGVDAPEMSDCYGEESFLEVERLLAGADIRLDKDISETDKYDRLLRYVVIEKGEGEDNILLNVHLVRQGFARVYRDPPNNRYNDLLSSAQEEAKRERRGVWSDECEYYAKEEGDTASKREKGSEPLDPDCVIKGNISEKGYGKTFLVPGCDNYNRVKIDTTKGENYFCTEAEALKAGFRKATNCP